MVVMCITTVVIAKLFFISCGCIILNGIVHSPSGHAALSFVFYISLSIIIWRSNGYFAGITSLIIALFIVMSVSVTRVTLHYHSVLEALIGICIGCLWLIIFIRQTRGRALNNFSSYIPLLCIFYILFQIIAQSSQRISHEGLLHLIGRQIQIYLDICSTN